MDRNAVRSVVVALVGVVAVAVAAAALPSTLSTDTGSGRGVTGSGEGFVGSGPGGILSHERAPVGLDLSTPLFLELLAALGLAALLVAMIRSLSLRDVAAVVAFAAVLLAGAAALAAVLPPLPVPESFPTLSPIGTDANGSVLGGAGGGGPDDPTEPTTPPLPVFLLVVAGFVGAVIALVRGREEPPGDVEPEPGSATPAPGDLGRIAGRAADRIEDAATGDAEADNEVYRAWLEMTRPLDVSAPDATTPGEFAAAAARAGIAPEDVSELTRLFEEVRYGGAEPTAEYERRAVAVLRRIETAHGSADG